MRLRSDELSIRPRFTHAPFASRNGRRTVPHAESHAHVGESVEEDTCRCAHAGPARCARDAQPAPELCYFADVSSFVLLGTLQPSDFKYNDTFWGGTLLHALAFKAARIAARPVSRHR